MPPTKFWIIWPSGFRGEDFQKSIKQKQELPVAAMFVSGPGQNEQSLQTTFHRCFLPSFGSFDKAVSEEKIFKNRPIRNKNCLWQPSIFVNGLGRNEPSQQRTFHRCILLSLVSLAKRFQWRRFFRNRPIRNKNCLWRPCLFMDRDEISNPYRGPAIDASHQVSDHLAKKFQRRKILKISQSETRIACGSHVCQWIGTN